MTAQSVAANLPGITDHVDTTGISWNDTKHMSAYFDYGSDSGTNVLAGNRAQRYDGGMYYYTNTFGFAASARKVGRYYEPVDGFVQHADIAGYALYENKIWLFDKKSWLNSIQFGSFIDRYHAQSGALNQTDNNLFLDVLTQSRIDVNSTSARATCCSTAACSRRSHRTASASRGTAARPTTPAATASTARRRRRRRSRTTPAGSARAASTRGSAARRCASGTRGTLSLEADDTRGYEDNGTTNVQWLERAGYAYATGANSSLALGVRRIIGTPPIVDIRSLPGFTGAWNLSFAFHHRTPHDELYFAYGDASQLSTLPQFVLKLIHYFGAEKGT